MSAGWLLNKTVDDDRKYIACNKPDCFEVLTPSCHDIFKVPLRVCEVEGQTAASHNSFTTAILCRP